MKTRYSALRESRSHLKQLYRVRLEHMTPITEPIALISQIQRSGGSLLSQLFDGHPEIYAHPDELMIGHPKKYVWPPIDLKDTPMEWFQMLFEENVIKHFSEGYKKGHRSEKTFAFMFPPYLQKMLFLQYLDSIETISQREVFNAYMTSYFGAWLNYQNTNAPKKFITGFTPRLAMVPESIESFFAVYSDGRLISIIRDPKNWFPSAHRHNDKKGKYEDIEKAMDQWIQNAQAMVQNKALYGSLVCIIRFEDLIGHTESVMRHLAEFLNIEFNPVLLTPTFNNAPIAANTSFTIENPGIMLAALNRYKTLSTEELNAIESLTGNDYRKVLDHAVSI
jgi:hypothetical protein